MVSNSRISVRSGSDSISNYNPRATPFYPSSFKVVPEADSYEPTPSSSVSSFPSQHYLPPQPFPSLVNPGPSLVCNIEVSNFDKKTKQTTFQELLDSVVSAFSHDDGSGDYTAAEYDLIQYSSGESETKESDTEDITDTDEDDVEEDSENKELKPLALIQVTWPLAYKLIEAFHGYEWHGRTLEAKIVSDSSHPRTFVPQPSGSIPPGISSGSSGSSRNSSVGGGSSFYSPYYPMYNPGPQYNPANYDYNSYNQLPPHHNLLLQQQQQHQHQHQHEQIPPYPGWADYSGTPGRNYLSRRPSNRSSEKISQSQIRSRSQSSQSSPIIHRSSSISSSSSNPAGVPPFIMNMVNSNHTGSSENKEGTTTEDPDIDSPTSYEHMQQNFNASRSEAIYVTNEEGQTVKVNPKRLFVGNIPFTSTWPALKNFLVSKSEEIEPDNNIEILRVEIPMQPQTSTKSAYGGNDFYLDNEVKQRQDIIHGGVGGGSGGSGSNGRGMSRGFAIVTTGDQESSEKLIKYFDDVEFEGRKLTVRFDKFPDFNNYLLQQLYPYSKNNMNNMHMHNMSNNHMNGNPFGPNGIPKSIVLSNLAFERNSFQQKFYYGRAAAAAYSSGGSSASPHVQMPMMYNPGVYYNNQGIIGSTVPPPVPPIPVNMPQIPGPNIPAPQAYSLSPDGSVSPQSEYVDQEMPPPLQAPEIFKSISSKTESPLNTDSQLNLRPSTSQQLPDASLPSSSKVATKSKSKDTKKEKESGGENDDQKARELVDSFRSMGLSS